jgi:hypothetical protein
VATILILKRHRDRLAASAVSAITAVARSGVERDRRSDLVLELAAEGQVASALAISAGRAPVVSETRVWETVGWDALHSAVETRWVSTGWVLTDWVEIVCSPDPELEHWVAAGIWGSGQRLGLAGSVQADRIWEDAGIAPASSALRWEPQVWETASVIPTVNSKVVR